MKSILPTVARNSFFEAFGKLGIKLISFIFTILIVRWLGNEDYGRYTLIWSYVVFFSLLSDAGLSMYAIREIAKRTVGSQYIVSNVIALRSILALVAISLTLFTVWLAGHSGQFLVQVLLASSVLLLYAIHDPLDSVLQAEERFDLSALAIGAGLIVFIVAGLVFLVLGWRITGFIVARLLNVVMSIIVVWLLLANYRTDLRWKLTPASWPGFLQTSLPFGFIKIWLSWTSRIDLIILGWYWSEQIVGWYGAAYALILGITILSNSINTALYPTLSRQYVQAPLLLPKIYNFTLKYLLAFSLFSAVIISFFAKQLTELLFGPEFAPAASILSILIWILPLICISEFLRYVMFVKNQEKTAAKMLLFRVALSVSLSLIFVPRYGFFAAAVVTLATEGGLVLLYYSHLNAELKLVNLGNITLRLVIAIVVLISWLNLQAAAPFLWAIVSGSLIYIVMLWSLRIIEPYEFEQIKSALKSRNSSPEVTMRREASAPLVSVFIPTYNNARYLTQAITSVLSQTYHNFELIIVDDGSTDETETILKSYQYQPKITVHRNPHNLGMAANWNVGISLCQGELIAKLDADDYYEPHFLETVVSFFQKHQTVGMVFSGLNLIYPDGRCEPELRFLHSWVKSRTTFLPILLHSCVIRSPTVCVRRECYQRLGPFIEELRLHADWEMWVRIAANYPVGFIAHRLANYRMSYGTNLTAQSIESGWSIDDLRYWLDLLKKNKLPYCLNADEDFKFRWGIYNLEMHFAGIVGYHKMSKMQQSYIDFAEEALSTRIPKNVTTEMRHAYFNLH
ncbi:MAG: glycosyltransferase, partial [Anaerolineae bacterium]|nr:glycosyltransferase [Anaerolineae bacterium]